MCLPWGKAGAVAKSKEFTVGKLDFGLRILNLLTSDL